MAVIAPYRPGGNITGFMQSPQPLWGKRLDLLTELLGGPPLRVGILGNPENVTFRASSSDRRRPIGPAVCESVAIGSMAASFSRRTLAILQNRPTFCYLNSRSDRRRRSV